MTLTMFAFLFIFRVSPKISKHHLTIYRYFQHETSS